MRCGFLKYAKMRAPLDAYEGVTSGQAFSYYNQSDSILC